MVIRFLCPNGHKIHCPEDRAGKPAKCPSCGAKFRVPEIEAAGERAVADDTPPSGIGSGIAKNATADEQIEFLCPNGHRLHGPASLQGKPGQCPECGSRFRVPSYDEVPDQEENEPEQQISLTDAEDLVTLQEADAEVSGIGGEEVSDVEADVPAEEPHGSVRAAELSGPISQAHPLAGVLAKLWTEKPRDASVEIHLAGGEKIIADRFARKDSLGSHGLFAVRDPNGTFTLTAIAWDAVQRVQIGGIERLPEMFKEES